MVCGEGQPDRVALVLDRMRTLAREIALQQQNVLMHLDLTMPQLKALFTVVREGEPAVGVIARELHVGLPSASQIVDRLVKAGFVERHPHPLDRRVTLCVLSARGQALSRELNAGPKALKEWLASMEPEALAQLQQGLDALAARAMASRQKGEENNGD
jgi:DNA-binding MarR family transcriptional regulator